MSCGYLEEVKEIVGRMRQRLESGQGTRASAMCRLPLSDAERLLEIIDALARGRVTEWHAVRVSANMLQAYLRNSDGWSPNGDDMDAITKWYSDNECEGSVHPAIPMRAIQVLACAEGRGELEVWLDVVGGSR